MDPDYFGAIKLKDGLFLGDRYAAQDLEFIVSNKVTHIVNTVSSEVTNHWERISVAYLNLDWHETQLHLTPAELAQIAVFVEAAHAAGSSVLLHSVRGQRRAVFLAVAWFMRTYRWALAKAVEFMRYRKPDLAIDDWTPLQALLFDECTARWTELSGTLHIDSEELLLRNTFVNAQSAQFVDYTALSSDVSSELIRWADIYEARPPPCKNKVANGCIVLKSCLKGAEKQPQLVPLVCIQARANVLKAVKSNPRVIQPVGRTTSAKRLRPGRENSGSLVLPKEPIGEFSAAKGIEEGRKPNPRSRPFASGVRPPSPLIKNNKPVAKRPSWR